MLHVLGSSDDFLKAVVLRHIVSGWSSDDVNSVSSPLLMLATHGKTSGADLFALRLLAQHGIGDPQWITGWLEFKRDHHEKHLAEIEKILRILKDRGVA